MMTTVTTNPALILGHIGRSECWTGVLRNAAGEVVAECGHVHLNRDTSSRFRPAATQCMETMVRKVIFGKIAEREAEFAAVRQQAIALTGHDQYAGRKLHALDQRAVDLAPIIGGGPVFRSGRLLAVASQDVYDAWLATTPTAEQIKFFGKA